MIETAVVIGIDGRPIYWHTPRGRTAGSIPDSSKLWEVIWENRDRISGIAHTHPGSGAAVPSNTDLTTFCAVERGLGKFLNWWILTSDSAVVLHYADDLVYHPLTYEGWGYEYYMEHIEDPDWAPSLRDLSGCAP